MKDSLKTWSRPNILFLHPFFITALEIPSIFSYSFQSKIFDRAKALCCITKAKERLHLFDKKEFDELPHVKTYYVELILMRLVSICTKMSHQLASMMQKKQSSSTEKHLMKFVYVLQIVSKKKMTVKVFSNFYHKYSIRTEFYSHRPNPMCISTFCMQKTCMMTLPPHHCTLNGNKKWQVIRTYHKFFF